MKKRWKVICKEGLFKFASNIGLARIYITLKDFYTKI